MDYRDVVYGFGTLHQEGFLQSEINSLLAKYPSLDLDKFNNALFGATCIKKGGEAIIYHIDILNALRCGIEKRDLTNSEWD